MEETSEHRGLLLPDSIITPEDCVLVTGAAGFIGVRVVKNLLERGFRNVRCFARPSSNLAGLKQIINAHGARANTEVIIGNLLSREDCLKASADVAVIYHLAAGTGTKSFADAFLNSVVTTRNLIEAALRGRCLRRFVSLSSFAVYTNLNHTRRGVLDERSAVEEHPESRAEAYCYAKVKQDELVTEYAHKHNLPFVLLRPGVVYGPGKSSITGRIGTDGFGVFLHLGGGNRIPFTFVENCADAVVLAGLREGVDGEVFNIVDDGLPTSREFLRLYKRHVRSFKSVYVPHAISYLLCYLWEKYSIWSEGQLPPVFTRREWAAFWKKTEYCNDKVKVRLGWSPRVPMDRGLKMFFDYCRERDKRA